MNGRDISTAKNPDLPGSLKALQRAGELARKIAIQTDTGIVVVRDRQIVVIDGKTLREQEQARNEAAANGKL